MIQWFSPRRRGGLWSARNKHRIEALVRAGRMAPGGQAAIDRAMAYEALADSTKRQYLWWIHSARRTATRAARVAETVRLVVQSKEQSVRPSGGADRA